MHLRAGVVSRIRQIKPSWFLDKQLRRGTTADAREFYVGLWMLADDAGFLIWDVERIGAELYAFDGIAARERNVEKWASMLETLDPDSPHLIVWTCGHARVPKMPGHQRIAGKQTFVVGEKHRDMCRAIVSRREPLVAIDPPDDPSEPTLATDSPGRVGKGRVGKGRDARKRDGETDSDFQRRVGKPAFMGGSAR